MDIHEKYMHRCIELARLGAGAVSPNPMVGCVIVCQGKIIGEGYHQQYGKAHAEVNAIRSVKNQHLLSKSTLYVTLEPCSHFGKTPPCTDRILSARIPNVAIGIPDPHEKVAGKGIQKLMKAGVNVQTGILEPECLGLNKRFITFHTKKRPYILLKWAQTLDAFIDLKRDSEQYGEPTWITGETALRLVHKIRSEEDAILVGTGTAEKDNPSLTVYNWAGRNPVRIVLDRSLRLNRNLKLFDNTAPTLVFNSLASEIHGNTRYIQIDFSENFLPCLLHILYTLNIQSVIIEGGRRTLQGFIHAGLWDEALIFTGNKLFCKGIPAPVVQGKLIAEEQLDGDWLKQVKNPDPSGI